jgi:outer membrane receptor protein involved in Fe transport
MVSNASGQDVAGSSVQTNADGSSANESDRPDQIIVTGSRIPRAGFDTLEPASVVSDEYIEARGLTNVADALRERPGFGGSARTPQGGQGNFSVGQNFVNLFGLGTNRTLTLVNGRRFVGSNVPVAGSADSGQQVDLNVIPTQLIERVEVVYVGGAPAYGSDAIAGTVNIILKNDFDGLLLSGRTGISERGDNFRVNTALIGGVNFAEGRGNITAALSYDRADGITGLDRERIRRGLTFQANPTVGTAAANLPGRTPGNDGRVNPNIPFNTSSSDGIPNSVLIQDARIGVITTGGLLLGPQLFTPALTPAGLGASNALLQFDSQGNLVPFTPGYSFSIFASGGDGYFLPQVTPVLADLKRYTGSLLAHYDLTPGITAFVESTYYRADARETIDQPVFNAPFLGGANGVLLFSATDPRLTDQARATLASVGVTQFRLARASEDILIGRASSRTDTYRIVGGFRGDIGLGARTLRWEASANLGRTKGRYFVPDLNQQNFVNAINVTRNAAGQIVCDPNPAVNVAPGALKPIVDTACVPLDVFGAGRVSEAARAYVTDVAQSIGTIEQDVYSANVAGSPFDLWAGPVSFSLGYEHREERAAFRPDEFLTQGRGRVTPLTAVSGGYNTDEVFGELIIPLIGPQNGLFIHRLELEGKARYVHNTVNGGFWAYTAGARIEPLAGVTFRGNYTRSLRAPSILELFSPVSTTNASFPDPCDAVNIAGGTKPSVRQQNCAAFFASYGITPPFNSIARSTAIPQRTGGNPSLQNEEARSYTFGAVIRPTFIPRLRLAVDWNRIRINGPIANLNAAAIANGCYDNPNFNTSDVDNANQFCSSFRRVRGGSNNGQLVNDPADPGVQTGFINGEFVLFKGLTAEADYNFPLRSFGGDTRAYVGGSLLYLDTLRSSTNGVTVVQSDGTYRNPELSAQMNFGISNGPFRADLTANYVSDVEYDRTFTAESQDILKLDDYWLFNAGLSYTVDERATFRFTVSNLFDTPPPFPTEGFGSQYDILQRRYTVSVDLRF